MDKYRNELKLGQDQAIPHETMLQEVVKQIDAVLDKSKYNKVDLRALFSFMTPQQHHQSALAH